MLNHFHASDYIFIMTSWESLLQSNNESLIIKQLVLIAFFILDIYIYIIYIYSKEETKKNYKFAVTLSFMLEQFSNCFTFFLEYRYKNIICN